MNIIQKIFRFVEDIRWQHELAELLSKQEKEQQARAQSKREASAIAPLQDQGGLQNRSAAEQPSVASPSPHPDFTQVKPMPTIVPEVEILGPEDRDSFNERWERSRRQIEAGAEQVRDRIQQIRSFNGLVVPMSKVGNVVDEGLGPQGVSPLFKDVRNRVLTRAALRIKIEIKP